MANTEFSKIRVPELQLDGFPERLIRVDWIADSVVRQQRGDQRSAFAIPLLLSVLRGSALSDVDALQADNAVRQQLLWVSVDFLPVVRAGSVWSRGRRLSILGFRNAVRLSLTVTGTGTDFVKLSEKIPGVSPWQHPGTPVPLSAHQLAPDGHWGQIKSQNLLGCELLAINGLPTARPGDPFAALFPAIELARFYGCPTSLLARELFAGGWPQLERPSGSNDTIVDGLTVIGQSKVKGLNLQSALYQAMYKFSPQMRSWVDVIGQQLAYVQPHERQGLRFGFPVDLPTQSVTVTCEAVPIFLSGDRNPARYLVLRIVDCDCRFAFDDVQANPHINSTQGENHGSSELETIRIPSGHVGSNSQHAGAEGRLADAADPDELSVAPDMPSADPDTVFFQDDDERLLFFSGKQVQPCGKEIQKHKYGGKREDEGSPSSNTVSANAARGGQSEQAEGQITMRDNAVPPERIPTLDLFVETLMVLREQLALGQCRAITHLSTNFPDAAGQVSYRGERMFRIVTPSTSRSGRIVRHLLLAEITFASGSRLLVGELERRTLSDNFAVFCCVSDFPDANALVNFFDALCNSIAKRSWLPIWNGQERTYRIGAGTFSGRRLTHANLQESATLYARKLAGLDDQSG